MAGVRRISSEVGYWIASVIALGGVFAAIAAGVAPHRLRPVAAFLVLWVGSGSYVLLAMYGKRRRALRLQSTPVPQGVRLGSPIWIPLVGTFSIVGVAAPLGALAAALGFPGVGIGIVLALGGGLGLLPILPLGGVSGLTFEPSGLRVHVRGAQFLVPWTSVLDVGVTGTSASPSANLVVAAPRQIIASLSPDTRRARTEAEVLLLLGTPSGQALAFNEWTAGLDSATLASAVREAIGGRHPHAN